MAHGAVHIFRHELVDWAHVSEASGMPDLMTVTPATISPSTGSRTTRVAIASTVGTTLESFDFYIYAYFSAFFSGPLFFTPLGHFGGTLAAFASIAVAFIVRPLGALIFGHIGDRLGRRKTLLWTVSIMGLATAFIGLLPTYVQIGWWAAVLLVALRVVQGLSLGGEWGGSILLASEHSSPVRRAFFASLPQLGSPIGSIGAAVAFLVMVAWLPTTAMATWGWRIPFLIALPLLAVSLYLRVTIDETPEFEKLQRENRRESTPLLTMFTSQPLPLSVATGAAILGIGSYSLMNTYTMDYGSAVLGFDYTALMVTTTIGGLLQLITIPTFGWLATRIGSATVVAWGAIGTLIIALPMYFLLQSATFTSLVVMMVVGGILPTMAWAALGGLMNDLFPGTIRYSALSFAYAIAATISGFVPLATKILGGATHEAWWHPAIVLAAMSVITLVCALTARRMSRFRTQPVE